MTVGEIMTKDPACCDEDTTLRKAAELMAENDCGCIPVIDDRRRPIGTITDRDIIVRALAESKDPLKMSVREVMTTQPVFIGEDASFDECYQTMEKNQIRRILVVNAAKECVGIVAQADIARNPACENEAAELLRQVSAPLTGGASM